MAPWNGPNQNSLLQACHDGSSCDVRRSTNSTDCCLNIESEQTTKTQAEDVADAHRILGQETGESRHPDNASTPAADSSLIVLLSRRRTRNVGRRLLNENAVVDFLVGRFGRRRVARFGDGRVDLTTAGRLFSRAAAVVGVHGGAFYNILLAPRGCAVVELMPLVVDDRRRRPPRRLAHTIIWRVADALGHSYWRLYADASSPRHDVTLSVDKLRSALASVT